MVAKCVVPCHPLLSLCRPWARIVPNRRKSVAQVSHMVRYAYRRYGVSSTRIGMWMGVRFENIQHVVDGLLDMQQFPLKSTHTACRACFLVHPMPKHVPRTSPSLSLFSAPSSHFLLSRACTPGPRVTPCLSAQCCVELECRLRWYVHSRLWSENGIDLEEPTIGAEMYQDRSEWCREHYK